jgi:hypothetical protein
LMPEELEPWELYDDYDFEESYEIDFEPGTY